MSTKRKRRHSPEQFVKKFRDADALLNAGTDGPSPFRHSLSERSQLCPHSQFVGQSSL